MLYLVQTAAALGFALSGTQLTTVGAPRTTDISARADIGIDSWRFGRGAGMASIERPNLGGAGFAEPAEQVQKNINAENWRFGHSPVGDQSTYTSGGAGFAEPDDGMAKAPMDGFRFGRGQGMASIERPNLGGAGFAEPADGKAGKPMDGFRFGYGSQDTSGYTSGGAGFSEPADGLAGKPMDGFRFGRGEGMASISRPNLGGAGFAEPADGLAKAPMDGFRFGYGSQDTSGYTSGGAGFSEPAYGKVVPVPEPVKAPEPEPVPEPVAEAAEEVEA